MKRRAAMGLVGEGEDPAMFGVKKRRYEKLCLILASFRIHDIRLHFRKNDSRSNEFGLITLTNPQYALSLSVYRPIKFQKSHDPISVKRNHFRNCRISTKLRSYLSVHIIWGFTTCAF